MHYRGMSVRIPAFFGYMHLAPHRNMCCFSQFTCTYCINTQNSVYSCIIVTDPSVIKYLSPIRFFALTSVGLGLLDL